MTTLLAALLGAVQGVTEFLPISSKTHLVVVPALLGEEPPSLAFIVLLHLGTLIALVTYFARDLWRIARDVISGGEGRRLGVLLLVASVPAGFLGLVFEETFERLLRHPREAAFALLITAILLIGAEWLAGTLRRASRLPRPLRGSPTTRDAVVIGLAQAVALFPGISRSGSTLSAGLAMGLRRDAVARFSFLLAIPALAGANLLELPTLLRDGVGAAEAAGFVTALAFGYASVAFLLRYLRRWNYLPFAGYCAIFGIVAGIALS